MPYCGLADVYLVSSAINRTPVSEALGLSRGAAQKALEIDPSLAEAQALIGRAAGFLDLDWKEAGRRFGLAMAREPVPPQVRHWYGFFYLQVIGRVREAVEEHRRALEEDPLRPTYHAGLAVCLVRDNRDEEALAVVRRALDLEPSYTHARYLGPMIHALRGKFAEALALAKDLPPLPGTRGLLAALLLQGGDRTGAAELLRQFSDTQGLGDAVNLAVFHFLSSDLDRGFEWAEKAIQRHEGLLFVSPVVRLLRAHPRWPALARMMNLPETAV